MDIGCRHDLWFEQNVSAQLNDYMTLGWLWKIVSLSPTTRRHPIIRDLITNSELKK